VAPGERINQFDGRIASQCLASDAYKIGRAELLVNARRMEEAEALLERVGPGSRDYSTALLVRFMLADLRPFGPESTAMERKVSEDFSTHFPKDFHAPLFAGIVAHRDEDMAAAVRLYDEARAMATGPGSSDFANWEWQFIVPLYNADRYDDVVRILRSSMAAEPDFWRRGGLVMVGAYSLVQVGEVDEAARMLATLAGKYPEAAADPLYSQAAAAVDSARAANASGKQQ
jgi:hypothetical protein